MVEETLQYAPFKLFEYDHKPGHYCLMLSDDSMETHMDLFDSNDRYGNGYAWADVAVYAMRSQSPKLEAVIDMDPEAGTFVAFGADLAALRGLAKLLSGAFHKPKQLADWVKNAPYEWD
jgi:hypothetical protein